MFSGFMSQWSKPSFFKYDIDAIIFTDILRVIYSEKWPKFIISFIRSPFYRKGIIIRFLNYYPF